MKSQQVSFAALKPTVTMEAVWRRYHVQELRGGHAGRIVGGARSTREKGGRRFTWTFGGRSSTVSRVERAEMY